MAKTEKNEPRSDEAQSTAPPVNPLELFGYFSTKDRREDASFEGNGGDGVRQTDVFRHFRVSADD